MFNFLRNILGFNDSNQQEFGSVDDYRVSLEPVSPRSGETISINYQGLLKNSGANEVYLHYGFDSWSKSVKTVKMERVENGDFNSRIRTEGNYEINFCFKDNVNNWDNNNGRDWTAHIQ